MKHIGNYKLLAGMLILSTALISCKKYLDKKPDPSLVIPSTLKDLQLLLDNENIMNMQEPELLETQKDDYYLPYSRYTTLAAEIRSSYIWEDVNYYTSWTVPYQGIYYANLVLDYLPKVNDNTTGTATRQSIKGSALLFRGLKLYNMAQVYCAPYDPTTSSKEPGLPLRLTSGVDEILARSTVQQTYNQIVTDLKEAATLLPATMPHKTQPNKPAAYGALARVCLSMGDFTNAKKYADSGLAIYNTLIDYNTLDSNQTNPQKLFNSEVIFHLAGSSSPIRPTYCRIDSTLAASFSTDDLRRAVLFQKNADKTVSFKAYDQIGSTAFFNGISTDELFITRAECKARDNDATGAMNDLNTVLIKRFKTGKFIPFTASTGEDALKIVLTERRKQLMWRGLRWTDIRRLNKDAKFKINLKRNLNGVEYTLAPGDPRFVRLIPPNVITLSGIQQNSR